MSSFPLLSTNDDDGENAKDRKLYKEDNNGYNVGSINFINEKNNSSSLFYQDDDEDDYLDRSPLQSSPPLTKTILVSPTQSFCEEENKKIDNEGKMKVLRWKCCRFHRCRFHINWKKCFRSLASCTALFDLIIIFLHVIFLFHLYDNNKWLNNNLLAQQIILIISFILPHVLCNIIFLRNTLNMSTFATICYTLVLGILLSIWFVIAGAFDDIFSFCRDFPCKCLEEGRVQTQADDDNNNRQQQHDKSSMSNATENAIPLKEYGFLRAVLMLYFEDVLQLIVQCWLFSLFYCDVSTAMLVLMVLVTVFTPVHMLWVCGRIYHEATKNIEQSTDRDAIEMREIFSMYDSVSLIIAKTLGIIGPSDNDAIEISYRIENGINNESSINLIGGTVTDRGCIALANAIRSTSSPLTHQQERLQRRPGGNGYVEMTTTICDNERSEEEDNGVSVQRLFLSRNKIGNNGFLSLSLALKEPGCAIKELWLDGNDHLSTSTITGWIEVGLALNTNESIEVLRLSKLEDSMMSEEENDSVCHIMNSHNERIMIC